MPDEPARTFDVLVPLPDGAEIAAQVRLADSGGSTPVLVSIYPYRKDDFIGASGAYAAEFFGARGYASVHVDIRGYGRSTGRAYQAWDPRELDDAAHVVEWVADQPWCDGKVGVWGASYGGASALGVATRRPRGLKAIASVYGAADIYHDFVYPGGCANGLGASAWGALMLALELAPPSLQDPEGGWLDAWRQRLDRLQDGEISSLIWPAHRDHDDYWRSRIVPVEDIEVPSFFVSGWRDLLCEGMLHAYERCGATKQLLVGPWTHAAPDTSADAPYDYLEEIGVWWDRWLKGIEPETPRAPVVYYLQADASWHAAEQWPPSGARETVLHPAPRAGLDPDAAEVTDRYEARSLVGIEAGLWFPMGVTFDDEFEQRRDDDLSLAYTSAPLDEGADVLGVPRAEVQVEVEGATEVNLCVKLCDVAPDGRSVLISSGWRRITAEEAAAGTVDARLDLYPTAYRVAPGHRLRWTVACADFPRLWPTPVAPVITVRSGSTAPSRFRAPLHQPAATDRSRTDPVLPPTGVNRAPWAISGEPICHLVRDTARDAVTVTAGSRVALRLPQGGRMDMDQTVSAHLEDARPAGATIRTAAQIDLELASGERFRVVTSGYALHGRRHLSGRVEADGELLLEQRWTSLNGVATPATRTLAPPS